MKLSDYIRLLSLAAIWGASFLFMRIAAPVLGPLPTAFLRVLLGAVGLAVILAVMKTAWAFKTRFRATLMLGIVNSGIPFLMYSIAATQLPAGYSAILNATTPLMGVLIGATFFGETLTLKKAGGVLLGLLGISLLTTTGAASFSVALLFGALACLVAFGSQIGATLFLLPFFGASAVVNPPASWGNTTVWLAMLAVGLVCTAFAYILYFRLVADIGPLRSLTVTFLIPPFGVLWGALFLGESLSDGHLYGGGLICLAVWLVLSRDKPATAPRKPAPT